MITSEQFALGCQRLADLWNSWFPDGPAWVWETASGGFTASLGGAYLAMQMVPRPAVTTSPVAPEPMSAKGLAQASEQEVPLSAEELQQRPRCLEVYWWTYHVIFSPSFGIPVMYFEAQDSGGSALTRAQILAYLSGRTPGMVPFDAVITQEEHPIVKRPFFMLHPCQTDEILSLLTEMRCRDGSDCCPGTRPEADLDPQLYMMAWLSVAGSVFGLQLPLEVWKEYWQESETGRSNCGTAVT